MAADELLQIVDENDNPTGTASRQEAYAKGLYHRLARIFILNEKGQALLQKRAEHLDTWPGCWTNSAAGHVDAGESYEEAAHRELQEELGVDGDLKEITTFKSQVTMGEKTLNRFNRLFRVDLPSSTEFRLQVEEVAEARWFDISDVEALIKDTPEYTTDGLRSTIKYLRAQ